MSELKVGRLKMDDRRVVLLVLVGFFLEFLGYFFKIVFFGMEDFGV